MGHENIPLEGVHDLHTKDVGDQQASVHEGSKRHGNVASAAAYDLDLEKSAQQECHWLGSLSFLHQAGAPEDAHQHLPDSSMASEVSADQTRIPSVPRAGLERSRIPPGRSKCTEAVGSALSVARVRHHRLGWTNKFSRVDYIESSQLVAADAYASHKASTKPRKLPTMARSIDTVLARSVSSPVHNCKQRTAQSYDFSPAISMKSSVGSTLGPGSENQSPMKAGPRARRSQSPCWPPVCHHVPAMSLLPAYAARTHKEKRAHAINRSSPDVCTQVPMASGKRTRCTSMSPLPLFGDTPPCSRASRSRPGSTQLRLPPLS